MLRCSARVLQFPARVLHFPARVLPLCLLIPCVVCPQHTAEPVTVQRLCASCAKGKTAAAGGLESSAKGAKCKRGAHRHSVPGGCSAAEVAERSAEAQEGHEMAPAKSSSEQRERGGGENRVKRGSLAAGEPLQRRVQRVGSSRVAIGVQGGGVQCLSR